MHTYLISHFVYIIPSGDFFKCPASGFEIVENLSQLRDKRENDLYVTILSTLHKVLVQVSTEDAKNFGAAVYERVTRPWGRKGEQAECHVLAIEALVNAAPKSVLHPQGRPAVIDLLMEALPPMPFPFTLQMLKDSVKLLSSPFGQVADTEEKFDFKDCDCVVEKRGRFQPSTHKPTCPKTAIVVLTSIYSFEEADRREKEDEVFMDMFEEAEEQARYWVQTEEGKVLLKKVCIQRTRDLGEEISIRQEMLLGDISQLLLFANGCII